jgi:hypothetical protein
VKNWKNRRPHVGTVLVAALLVVLLTQSVAARPAAQQAPVASNPAGPLAPTSTQFTYQGNLQDAGGNPIDGSVDMVFGLYHELTGGAAFWTEAHGAVPVTGGQFAVVLGSVTAINPALLTGDIYLELAVNGETLSPREQFTSVAYSVEAATLTAGATTLGPLTVAGNLATLGEVLHVNADGDPQTSSIQFQNNDAIVFDDSTYPPGTFSLDADGSTANARLLAGGAYLNTAFDSAYRLKTSGNTLLGGSLELEGHASLGDYELRNVRALQLKDWDDDSGGTDNTYRVLARDGAWVFYNGGVAIGPYANGNWTDLADGTLIVAANLGIGTIAPTEKLDVNGNINARGYLNMNSNSLTNLNRLRSDLEYIDFYKVATTSAEGARLGEVGIDSSYTNADTKLDALGGNSLWVKDKIQSGGEVTVGGNLHLGGTDLIMDEYAGRGGGRALVNFNDDVLAINYDHDFAGGVTIHGPVSCDAYVETNLQTEAEVAAGQISRFREGDVLCWGAGQLELCSAENDRLVQAVADARGRPIVLGAESIRVIGPVRAGDYLVASDVPGYAMASPNPTFGIVIAQALEDLAGERGLIKAMIRKM